MIQRILALLSFIVLIAIFIIGGIHWKAKLDDAVNHPGGYVQQTSPANTETVNGEENAEEDVSEGNVSGGNVSSETDGSLSLDQLKNFTTNLPKDLADIFKQAYYDERTVKLFIVGSPALGANADGWSAQVKEQLEMAYGEFVQVDIIEFDGTSTEFVDSVTAAAVIEEAPDLLLFEALTLEDNSGVVPIEISHDNLRTFLGKLMEANPKTGIIVQPPNPIYAAVNYPIQVVELKQFAEREGLHYLDHWVDWPDPNSPDILDYLNEEGLPNEKGHQLWADVVTEYFLGSDPSLTP